MCYYIDVNSVNLQDLERFMDNNILDKGVKERLILSGLHELLHHGTTDFSLRRVAVGAEVSCAAPYRHFKDKDELIRAIIAYIREDYNLLADNIKAIFGKGTREYVVELSVATVRFWIAGGNFPSFLQTGELSSFNAPMLEALELYLGDRADISNIKHTVMTLIYGSVTEIMSGDISADEAVLILRNSVSGVIG